MKVEDAQVQAIAEELRRNPTSAGAPSIQLLLDAVAERDALIVRITEKSQERQDENAALRARIVECVMFNDQVQDYLAIHTAYETAPRVACPKCQFEMPMEELIREHTCMSATVSVEL